MEGERASGKGVKEDIFADEYDKWIWSDTLAKTKSAKDDKASSSSANSDYSQSRNSSCSPLPKRSSACRNGSSSEDGDPSSRETSTKPFKTKSFRKRNLSTGSEGHNSNPGDGSPSPNQSRISQERLPYVCDFKHSQQRASSLRIYDEKKDFLSSYKKSFDPLPSGRSGEERSTLSRSPVRKSSDRSSSVEQSNLHSRSRSKDQSPSAFRKSPKKDTKTDNVNRKSVSDSRHSRFHRNRSRSRSRDKKYSRTSKSRSRSKSKDRRRGKSPRRRSRSKDRHSDRDRKHSSRGRNKRSRSRDTYRRSRSRSYDRRRGHRNRYRSSSRDRYHRRRRSRSGSRSRSRTQDSSKGRSGSNNRKPGSLPLSTSGGAITPQMALQQTMAALNAKAQALTGIALPKYYNPAAVNPLKYAEQVQKRKLLWQTKEKVEEQPKNSVWDKLTFSQDQDGKMTAKFRKLMGIKSEGASKEVDVVEDVVLKKQEELFRDLDQQYEMARVTTHTQRGVGLGYSAQALYPPVQK